MNLSEGYNSAVAQYGANIANKISQAGISKNYCEAACRFYKEGIPLEQLQDDFKKWNRYIVHNALIHNGKEKDLRQYRTYLEFRRAIQTAMQPFICPNPLYDDSAISIGELKTQKDARWFPIQNLAYPDANNDFCVCKKAGGYQQFQRYVKDGRRLFIIYDKQRAPEDKYKRVLMMSKNGRLYFWNNFDKPCGTTEDKNSEIWQYIDGLPREAQIILSDIAEGIKESISNHNQNREYAYLREIIKEALRDTFRELLS